MSNLYLHLLRLREQLDGGLAAEQPDGSVLSAVPGELLRRYNELPYAQLYLCSPALQDQFYRAQWALQQPPAIALPNVQAQCLQTEQALTVLEQVASCTRKQQSFA